MEDTPSGPLTDHITTREAKMAGLETGLDSGCGVLRTFVTRSNGQERCTAPFNSFWRGVAGPNQSVVRTNQETNFGPPESNQMPSTGLHFAKDYENTYGRGNETDYSPNGN